MKTPVDAEGSIVGCPACKGTALRKDGKQYFKNREPRQRWWCLGCGRKTIAPIVLAEAEFEVTSKSPLEDTPIDELIDLREKRFSRRTKYRQSQDLINIKMPSNAPIGIVHFGDPHIDDDGTDIAEIFQLVEMIQKTKGLYAGNVGDLHNNWIGRLEALYKNQGTTAKEAWRLTEHFIGQVPWLYLVAGNHDLWSGKGDPLDWIMRTHPGVYDKYQGRLNLCFPNGRKVRIQCRHQFKGNSIYNSAHGVARAIRFGQRDHILTCGHIHVSGYQVLRDPQSGLISHGLQIASFKKIDDYADRLGLEDNNIFNAPVTIIDPRYEDSDNRLITTIFNAFEGGEYLTWKRSEYESASRRRKRSNVSAKGRKKEVGK